MIERDARQLARQIKADFTSIPPPSDWIWGQCPAAKVIDCVLSLRKQYHSVVEPRVKQFVASRPKVITCGDLRRLIDSYETRVGFIKQELDMASPTKASMLSAVTDYLLDIQVHFDGPTEQERLTEWAQWARPGDYIALDVPHFKLAGFQYLRMLFGASTTKPDVHILRYVRRTLNRETSKGRAVYVLERAAEILEVPARDLDVAIWNWAVRKNLVPADTSRCTG